MLIGVAIKGRLKTYYREGRVNSCMPYWNDFWFCLKAKIMNEDKLQVCQYMCPANYISTDGI